MFLMMEEKQLDFNRPLLSVRRPTQTSEPESKTRSFDSVTNKMMIPPSSSSPPVFKSDIKSGPVRNPGTVPFQWEHQPGKPKDETKPSDSQRFVPKLPPGRREEVERKTANHQIKTSSDNVSSLDANSSWYGDDDCDDTYLDAADTLSRSESFSFNCSHVSGLDSSGILVEPFGSLSSDRQTQDLMMGRFLPAAKALTSESPPHLARKQPTKPEEAPRQLMKKEKQNPYRFRHSPDQEEEDGGNRSSVMASGVCGLVPQFCLRSSLGILNPVPSVRMQAQRAVSVRRMRSSTPTSNENHNKRTNETVNEDKRKLKPNELVSQGSSQGESSLPVSSIPERKEKLDNVCTASRTKVSKNFGELLASDDNTWKPTTETPVAEKTVYVDTVHSVDKKVQEESKEQSLLKHGANEEAISQPKSTEQMNVNKDEDFIELLSRKGEECPQDCNQAIVTLPESNVVEITKERIDLESSRLHHRSSYHIVPPPPLPKAPADSWLKRTLPTIPAKNNVFTWLTFLDADNNQFNKIQANPKWETMVKTSNTQQGSVHFPKELLNPIPEA